jgi:uncharacterized protein YjbI with pentapeptide repeats
VERRQDVVHIASEYASRYLNGFTEYIPVFVPLIDKRKRVFYDNDLDFVLDQIIAPPKRRDRKILLILDGYGLDVDSPVGELMTYLTKRHSQLRNMKVIITTRRKAGIPQALDIGNRYVRLLPFDKSQINQFFIKYGMSNLQFEDLLNYGLRKEDIGKPLFCWMIAIINSGTGGQVFDVDEDLKKTIIYQEFIHSTISGKHKELASRELASRDYEFSVEDVNKEKRTLRKIAALKMLYESNLDKNVITDKISAFEEVVSLYKPKSGKELEGEEEKRSGETEKELSQVISSYFYSEGSGSDAKINFIHESFKEYLLAEYYIESLLMDKPYRLNIGIPNEETISFLYGLLQLISKNVTSSLESKVDRFLGSLSTNTESKERLKKISVKSILINNARTTLENEQVVFHQQTNVEKNELWNVISLAASRYQDLWIHRWISMYVLKTIEPNSNVDKVKLLSFVQGTDHSIPFYLKKLNGVDFSNSNLSGAELSNANLSYANLSYANLQRANLSDAKLIGANLSGSDLSRAELKGADLSYADLSNANLPRAILFYATLSYANFSEAVLDYTNLTDATLTGAILSNASLQYAQLSNIKTDNTKFDNANLANAFPSEIVSAIKSSSGPKKNSS